MTPFRTLLIGDAPLSIHCAEILLSRGHKISAIATAAEGVTTWAQTQGLAVIPPGAGLGARLAGHDFDWLFNIAGLARIETEVIARARCGAINFHDGPLPGYAGLNTPVWALIRGEQSHGVTWHLVREGIDTGDILLTHPVVIDDDDTALSLNTKCMTAGIESFGRLIGAIETGRLVPVAQPAGPARRLFRAAERPPLAGRLDFSQPGVALLRLVRALDHGPYWNPLTLPKIEIAGQVLCVGRAVAGDGSGLPGTVLAVGTDALTIACADGAVAVSSLTSQDGLPVDPSELTAAGDRLPAPDPGLTEMLARSAAHEAYWRRALRAMAPAALPGLHDSTAAPDHRMVPLTGLPPGLAPARLGAALTALALGMSGSGRTDLAVGLDGSAYLAAWGPVAAQVDQTFAELEAAIADACARPSWPRDLIARDPQLDRPETPPVALGFETAIPGAVLTLVVSPTQPACLIHDAARMAPEQAEALAARLVHLAVHADPELALGRQDMLPPAERQALLAAGNDTTLSYDRTCIHEAFEAQVARTPDAPALVFEETTLSYAELDARANRAAHVLHAMGVGPGQPVALCTQRGPQMLVGALAILKAGGAYVPMDPAYPSERLAHYLADSAARVIVTEHAMLDVLPAHDAALLQLDTDTRISEAPATAPERSADANSLAYVIYTSGSTGMPKGVMIEHGNVANFFAGMDERISHDPPGVWLAVTSLSFDISVLELFWTLARGFKVVLMGDADRLAASRAGVAVSEGGMEFSLFYWGNDDGPGRQKYRLLIEGARFADTHGFCAVWTPERHFHAFGGPYPNPAVTGAAVAAVTQNIAVRAGSCVAPLHHPIRIAEEWAVIDNLTGGRTGLGIASGWHPVDFVLRPENRHPNNKRAMFDAIDTLRRLWRGEEVAFDKGDGPVPVRSLPRPVQEELPLWLTIAGNPDTWREAGEIGAHVLTHLLGQSIDEVAEKIGIYHDALRASGRDPADYKVTLMLHSFVARDRDHARSIARKPMQDYLLSAAGLVKQYAWAFPAFKRPQGARNPMDIDLSSLSPDEVAGILEYAFNRYFEDSGLFGTVEDCLARVEQLKRIGVSEIACLIDYGIAPDTVLEALYPLAEVVRRANAGLAPAEDDFSLAAQIVRHGVTHFQCTPSMARMLLGDEAARAALAKLRHLMIGGEPLPGPLAAELSALTGQPVQNMYGPTETTIWSSTAMTRGGAGIEALGLPIANTQLYVIDAAMQPVPDGVAGELWIGGDGVARGYWQRPELTAERFRPNPFGPGRIYRSGDLVRRERNGQLACLGRADHQIKLRGYRIEPGEIEAALQALPGITGAVVTAREDIPGDLRLVAYVTGAAQGDLRSALSARLPAHMVPAHVVFLETFPLTPNRKIDRAALPSPRALAPTPAPASDIGGTGSGTAAPRSDILERIASVWADVLGVDTVAAGDNFFNLGGHSLLAVQAHRTLRGDLGLTGLSITDIFRFPVLRDLAAHVESRLCPQPAVAAPGSGADTPAPPVSGAAARKDAMAQRREMRARRLART